jgi:hypothetical protein
MNRTAVTYGQLDRALRSLGFTCRPAKEAPPGRVYEHGKSGAVIILPDFPDQDKVLEYHLITARTTLDGFGIADPHLFDAKLQKAG